MSRRPTFIADCRASTAVEFALVLPVLLMFLFAIIDIGRLYFTVNEAEKATQMGARYAIVTNTIPAKIAEADYVGSMVCDADGNGVYEACTQGGFIKDPAALGTVKCTATSCTCASGTCPSGTAMATNAFKNLGDHMRKFDPAIADGNINLYFRSSGLGFAGDPTGMDVVPLVTVELHDLSFTPLALFNVATFNLPDARTTLSAESSAGTQSN